MTPTSSTDPTPEGRVTVVEQFIWRSVTVSVIYEAGWLNLGEQIRTARFN
jgi:hypothetical protein